MKILDHVCIFFFSDTSDTFPGFIESESSHVVHVLHVLHFRSVKDRRNPPSKLATPWLLL